MQSKLIMMMGVPGSGKSTAAQMIANENRAIVISSDQIRVEFLESGTKIENEEVFKLLYKRAKQELLKGNNVVIDSTNLSGKRRKNALNFLKGCFSESEIYFMNTNYNVCYERNSERDSPVPDENLGMMMLHMQVPLESEGWDNIRVISSGTEYEHTFFFKSPIKEYPSSKEEFRKMIEEFLCKDDLDPFELYYSFLQQYEIFQTIFELSHDNSHHFLNVYLHTYYTFDHIKKTYPQTDKEEFMKMLWTALLHDIGKSITKSFEQGKRYASFKSHEYVGASLAANFLFDLGYDNSFCLHVAQLISMHMLLLDEKAKTNEKIVLKCGKDFSRLIALREADSLAK